MCHALVIEDEPFAAMMIEDALLAMGAISVDIATTEAEAIEVAQDRPPAVITSDIWSLEGTGPKAVAAILQQFGDIPVVFITSTPAECEPCDYARAVLAKPVDPMHLTRVVRPLLSVVVNRR